MSLEVVSDFKGQIERNYVSSPVIPSLKAIFVAALLSTSSAYSAGMEYTCEDLKKSREGDRLRYLGYHTGCDIFCKAGYRILPTESASTRCKQYLTGDLSPYTDFDPNKDLYKPFEQRTYPVCDISEGNTVEKKLTSIVRSLESPDSRFVDFRYPNEAYPEQIRLSFQQATPGGVLVSVGSERGFFTLATAVDGFFRGLVVRDINPAIKAYVDFNVLLLRLAETREEYVQLAEMRGTDGLEEEILASDIPDEMKTYYLDNLSVLSTAYQEVPKWQDCPAFDRVDYSKSDQLFRKMKKMADLGRIVAVTGDITDLDFLQEEKISLIDVSNVYEYSPSMSFKETELDHPVIVYTDLGRKFQAGGCPSNVYNTRFHSYMLGVPSSGDSIQYFVSRRRYLNDY